MMNSSFTYALYIIRFIVTVTDLSKEMKWRLMLGLGGVVPIIIIISLAKLPESPRWLMLKGRKDEATQVKRVCLWLPNFIHCLCMCLDDVPILG